MWENVFSTLRQGGWDIEHKQLFGVFKADYLEDSITIQVALCKKVIDAVLWIQVYPGPKHGEGVPYHKTRVHP